jgi:hypothetical protein
MRIVYSRHRSPVLSCAGAKRGRGGRGGSFGGRGRGESFSSEVGESAGPIVPAAPQTPIQQQFAMFATYLDERVRRVERGRVRTSEGTGIAPSLT